MDQGEPLQPPCKKTGQQGDQEAQQSLRYSLLQLISIMMQHYGQ